MISIKHNSKTKNLTIALNFSQSNKLTYDEIKHIENVTFPSIIDEIKTEKKKQENYESILALRGPSKSRKTNRR